MSDVLTAPADETQRLQRQITTLQAELEKQKLKSFKYFQSSQANHRLYWKYKTLAEEMTIERDQMHEQLEYATKRSDRLKENLTEAKSKYDLEHEAYMDLFRQLSEYERKEAASPALLKALKTARQYVVAMQSNVARAIGHENTLVKPDLDEVDAALAKAEPQSTPAENGGVK